MSLHCQFDVRYPAYCHTGMIKAYPTSRKNNKRLDELTSCKRIIVLTLSEYRQLKQEKVLVHKKALP